jgi:hypothetical protein
MTYRPARHRLETYSGEDKAPPGRCGGAPDRGRPYDCQARSGCTGAQPCVVESVDENANPPLAILRKLLS